MNTKSDKTKQFIIETVAPVFNKYGYAATSLSDITKATGLTKGSIYGNFKNKEEIAIEAFKYNIKIIIKAIGSKIEAEQSSSKKLFAITEFYRHYRKYTNDFGGCPILNFGIDSKYQNPLLHKMVMNSIDRVLKFISSVIEQGIREHEFNPDIDSNKYARKILSIIDGSVFLMITMDDESYLINMMDHIDQIIISEILI